MFRTTAAILLTATALVPAAMAQTANDSRQTAERQQACHQLTAIAQRGDFEASGLTPEEINRIAEGGDAETCRDAVRVAEGEISWQEGDPRYDADATARLRVIVPEPEVLVHQAAPDVTVEQAQPRVNVDPGRPIVTVQQAEPVVRVEVPQPRVTIDIPKPRILVEMPDPNVDVQMAQPRVSVEQAQPTVEVEQGEVAIEMGDATQTEVGAEQARVSIEQQDAQVTVQPANQARVSISEVQPDVRYESAEPRIEVQQSGEPQIIFNQSGEAEVSFRQMTAEETRKEAERNQQSAVDQEAGAEARSKDRTATVAQKQNLGETATDRRAAATQQQQEVEAADRPTATAGEQDAGQDRSYAVVGTGAETDAVQQQNTRRFSLEQLNEMSVIGANGDQIGDVEDVVLHQGETYIIVGSGGFLGIGERAVALPLSDMVVRDDQLVMRSLVEEDVENMRDVNLENIRPHQPNTQLDVNID